MAGQGLASSIPPCNGAEPSRCSSESLFFPYVLILLQVSVFSVSFPQFTVYPRLNKFVSVSVLFSTLCMSLANMLSRSISTCLSRYLRSLHLGCAAELYPDLPSAHTRLQPGEEDSKQASRSHSNCGHTSASCGQMLKAEMFFSRERRCS